MKSGPLIGGKFKQGSSCGLLYEKLQDEKPHAMSEILQGIPAGNPKDRLKWLVFHGNATGWWRVDVAGNTVQMKILHKP